MVHDMIKNHTHALFQTSSKFIVEKLYRAYYIFERKKNVSGDAFEKGSKKKEREREKEKEKGSQLVFE